MMDDPFRNAPIAASDPAVSHWEIEPSDDDDLDVRPRGLFVSAGGNVVLRDEQGQDLSYPVATGAILPFRPVRVLASGTTATVYGWS